MNTRRLVAAATLVGGLLVGITPPAASDAPSRPTEAAPVLRADYRFHNVLTSSVAGAPALRNINRNGNNSFATENVDGTNRRVLRFPERNGLRLGNVTSIIARDRYTIAVRLRFDDVETYARVLNFRPDSASSSDTGLYVQGGDLVFYQRAFPDLDVIDADEWVTVVMTRAANNVVRGFVDGQQVFAFTDGLNRSRIDKNNIVRFFRDDANREESSGAVARIRIWDRPLTPAQVAALPQ